MKLDETGEYLLLEDGDVIPEGAEVRNSKLEWAATRYVGMEQTDDDQPRRIAIDRWRGVRDGVTYRIVLGRDGARCKVGDMLFYMCNLETYLREDRWKNCYKFVTDDPEWGCAGVSLDEYEFVFRPVDATHQHNFIPDPNKTVYMCECGVIDDPCQEYPSARRGDSVSDKSSAEQSAESAVQHPLCAICNEPYSPERDFEWTYCTGKEIGTHGDCWNSMTRLERVLAGLEEDPYIAHRIDLIHGDDPESRIFTAIPEATMWPGYTKPEPIPMQEQWGEEFE